MQDQPRIALLYSVPLLREALLEVFEDIAEVQAFPAARGDTTGLLRSVSPDAVVVDNADEAENAAPWAKLHGLPLVFISLRERKIKLLKNGGWEESPGTDAETVRNLLAGSMFRREGATG